jgi:hypothetical protein
MDKAFVTATWAVFELDGSGSVVLSAFVSRGVASCPDGSVSGRARHIGMTGTKRTKLTYMNAHMSNSIKETRAPQDEQVEELCQDDAGGAEKPRKK